MRVGESERLGRERVGINERQRVSAGARQQLGGQQVASDRERFGGQTYGFGQPGFYGFGQPSFYNEAPGMQVAGVNRGAIAWCQTRFQSFDPATGTYMGFDGIRHACP
jgi:hypothetical protein